MRRPGRSLAYAGRGRWALLALAVVLVAASCTSPGLTPLVMVTREPVQLAPTQLSASPLPQAAAPAPFPVQVAQEQLAPAGSPDLATQGEVARVAPDATPTEKGGPGALQRTQNILLLGTDQQDLNYLGRTDTLIILALDLAQQRAALVSLPRDIYLPAPGLGYTRINNAYAYGETIRPGGGIPLLISTIEKNFHIPIHNYLRIDFSGFKEVIDALGGVDITVDCPLYDELVPRYFGVVTLEPGEYHMNGEQALYYARSRKTTSDFDRARRQQQVLMAMRRHMLEGNLLSRAPALWVALRDTVDTDLGVNDVAALARLGATINSQHLYGMVLRPPLVSAWVTPQGAQVQLPDLPAIAEALEHVWERKPLTETNQEERACP